MMRSRKKKKSKKKWKSGEEKVNVKMYFGETIYIDLKKELRSFAR